jgi:hypothetical protein
MAIDPMAALVEEVLIHVPDYREECIRSEAVNLAFDMRLGAAELAALLAALEERTGTRLERREMTRMTYMQLSRYKQ